MQKYVIQDIIFRMYEKKNWLKELTRRIYITASTFMENDLKTYAASGAYSFILSALPILLMVFVVLLRVFYKTPETILDFFETSINHLSGFDFNGTLTSLISIKSIGLFEIIIGISVFWMARRFFASFQRGLRKIYRKRQKGARITENLLLIAGQVLLVIFIVSIVIAIITGKAFFKSPLAGNLINPILLSIFQKLFRFMPFAGIFIFITAVYFFIPRMRPDFVTSVISGAATTASFSIVQYAFSTFINLTRYNLVYGILSNTIVLILEVYAFFLLFFFWAQFMYVSQFYESFLLSRLCLLPYSSEHNILKRFERMLFIHPLLFYQKYAFSVQEGEILFTLGDNSQELYYIWNGEVVQNIDGQTVISREGAVFGELSSISGGSRITSARALTDSVLLKIPGDIFRETLEVDGELSRKTLQMLADYLSTKNADSLFPH